MFPSTSATAPRFLRFPFTATAPRRAMAASAGAPSDAPPQSPSPKAVRVVVKGRVQGVFFRDWTVETARSLGLSGWVCNRRDGTVEALLSGDPDKVDDSTRWCPAGSPSARPPPPSLPSCPPPPIPLTPPKGSTASPPPDGSFAISCGGVVLRELCCQSWQVLVTEELLEIFF
ncbi:unnamed protein product [Urochloa humidicola]